MELMGNIIFNIIAMLVTLGILVTFHEFGHFWVARRCGVKVEKFSIGFGKALFRWRGKPSTVAAGASGSALQQGEPTEFVIAALPLGGFVKMLGEQDSDVPESMKHMAFNYKPLYQRAAIVAAGPVANFLLAVVLYWMMFMGGVSGVAPVIGDVEVQSPAAIAGIRPGDEIVMVDGKETRTWQEVRIKFLERLGESGPLTITLVNHDSSLQREVSIPLERWLVNVSEPETVSALGIEEFRLDIPARLGEILPGGRAEQAGLLSGDLVTAVNGEDISGWLDWIDVIRDNAETDLAVSIVRDDAPRTLTLRPELTAGEDGRSRGYIGAGVMEPETWPTYPEYMNRSISYNPVAAIPRALGETWNNSLFVLDAIKKMIIGLISVENISGPITIAQIAGQTASYGFEYFVGFLAILSISLGVFNLLPIPVLDGGHLFYYAIEAVIRRPVPEGVQEFGLRFGLLILAGIVFIAFYNDINRLF